MLLVVVGLLLRGVLLVAAENRLDADEAAVALMALDVFEGANTPMFFSVSTEVVDPWRDGAGTIGNAYNGGSAFEAYLAAALWTVTGPHEIGLKVVVLGLWLATAALFVNLCRRAFDPRTALVAVAIFCLGTPFFLEWSLKARGVAESVLVATLLVWLAEPPAWLRERVALRAAAFGVLSGLGLWASETLLPMIPCAGAWLLRGCARRGRCVGWAVGGGLLGLGPLLAYNWTHEWSNFRQSVFYAVLQDREQQALTLEQLRLSAEFVLGPTWFVALGILLLAAFRLAARIPRWSLAHVFLVHTVLFVVAYALSGMRYMPVPPSRGLYALYPGLAILIAHALPIPRAPSHVSRVIAALAVAAWLVPTALATARWLDSGAPREAGSWRGTWSLVDGAALQQELAALGVDVAYTGRWTWPAVNLATRLRSHRDPTLPKVRATFQLPVAQPPPGISVAFVLHADTPLRRRVEARLESWKLPFVAKDWNGLRILHGLDSSQLYARRGLPRTIMKEDWPARPAAPDGFN